MLTRNITKLPGVFQTEPVLQYYLILRGKCGYLWIKRGLDILISLLLLLILSPLLLLTALLVKCTSRGPVFYRQERVGKNGKSFWILKFRTMVKNADHMGAPITVGNRDSRITVIGHVLRASRIDEFPQFINVLKGDMSIIGARPEVPRYVREYTPEMYATLLLAPGMTGVASIVYRQESELLADQKNPENYYIQEILPKKMAINLKYLKSISFFTDAKLILKSLACVFQ